MMGLAQLLIACALFVGLAAIAVAAAFKAARVEDRIGEVFATWLHDPFDDSDTSPGAEPARKGAEPRRPASESRGIPAAP